MKLEKVAGNIAKIDDKYYQVIEDGNGRFEFKEIKNFKNHEKLVKQIVEKISYALDREAVLKDALTELPTKDVKAMHKRIFKFKTEPKLETKKGCVEMKVGRFIIPIR